MLELQNMNPYSNYSKFYDAVEGEKKDYVSFLSKAIKNFSPNAKSMLELGCGTGYVLQGLHKKGFCVEGLDISKEMLKVAGKRKPKFTLYEQDISNFNTNTSYDVIIAVYDTFNHITNIKDVEKGFIRVKKHLNKGGLFLFDLNTIDRMNRFLLSGPYSLWFDENLFVMEIVGRKKDIFDLRVRIFQKQKTGLFKMYEDNIKEVIYDVNQIQRLLKKHFSSVHLFDGEDYLLKPSAERVYFACKV